MNTKNYNILKHNLKSGRLTAERIRHNSLSDADLSDADLSDADLSDAYLQQSTGISYAQAASAGHGETGRMHTAIHLPGDVPRFTCGCEVNKTGIEMWHYIKHNNPDLKASRLRTFRFLIAGLRDQL